jgi:hypothetical protein
VGDCASALTTGLWQRPAGISWDSCAQVARELPKLRGRRWFHVQHGWNQCIETQDFDDTYEPPPMPWYRTMSVVVASGGSA